MVVLWENDKSNPDPYVVSAACKLILFILDAKFI